MIQAASHSACFASSPEPSDRLGTRQMTSSAADSAQRREEVANRRWLEEVVLFVTLVAVAATTIGLSCWLVYQFAHLFVQFNRIDMLRGVFGL